MPKDQDLGCHRSTRPEQSDQRRPDKAESFLHRTERLRDSALVVSPIEFATGTAALGLSKAGPQGRGLRTALTDLLRRGQLHYVHRGPIAALLARPAFERGFQLPDRRIPRPADCSGCAPLPASPTAIEALPDRWRWLRGAAVALHLNRPRLRLGAIRLTGGFLGFFPRMSRVDFRAHDLAAPDDLSRFGAHKGRFSGSCEPEQCH
jgi:hypothetical protein